ncbi:patatin-like phospholipase family protein [Phenylobacterium sp.]|uniref:patatin-like phospholipase family protein n=1 Tax=Phenylobacterium sp. TaxID=1871053 RepID=UPI002F41FEE1
MTRLPDIPQDSALAQLFSGERARGEAAWFSLPGGAVLYEAGEPADQLYFVRAGRLAVFRKDERHEPQFLGVIRPGEPVGEMALIAGAPHSAQVVALRDSEILALPRQAFFDACDSDTRVMTELARLMILRTRQAAARTGVGEPSVFGFITAGEGLALRPLVDRIARDIGRLGYAATVVGAEATQAPTEWFSDVERTHDFVLYVAEADDLGWRQLVSRQADRLFRVARGGRPPPAPQAASSAAPLQAQRLVDLVLVDPAKTAKITGSEAWMDAVSPARIFHLRRDDAEDGRRIARVLTGQSVGLVLSGGGARAYAHVGAVKALRERNVPIDFVGGASMGAIVAAGVAMDWDDEEMERRIREAFVETSPLDDIALPLLAMTHGNKVAERLAHHFGDVQIADLRLPFFCVSSNLTTGAYHLHRRGRLRDALRASISLPGVLPPATEGHDVLVDGAVLKNFPADVMRAVQLGPIVGIDVTRGRSITAEDVARPESVWRWILSGQWRKGPPIVSLLMRAATVSSGRDLAASREATDVLVTPEVAGVEIRDWSAFAPAVKAGYEAMIAALDKLDRPVVDLRRRPALADADAAE